MTDEGPRFSVVVPAFDEADYLGTSLRSLQQQDFGGDYEIIVVDNGSSDDTVAVARAAASGCCRSPAPACVPPASGGSRVPAGATWSRPTPTPCTPSTG